MSLLSIDPTTLGKPIFDDPTTLRAKDDAGDNKVSGVYSHKNIEFSATEANEWQSFISYISGLLKGGGVALAVRNETGSPIVAGAVTVTGYSVAEAKYLITPASNASADLPAQYLLLDTLADDTDGIAYISGEFVSAVDTRASTIGNPVYLGPTGTLVLAKPASGIQVVGFVKTLSATGTVVGLIGPMTKAV